MPAWKNTFGAAPSPTTSHNTLTFNTSATVSTTGRRLLCRAAATSVREGSSILSTADKGIAARSSPGSGSRPTPCRLSRDASGTLRSWSRPVRAGGAGHGQDKPSHPNDAGVPGAHVVIQPADTGAHLVKQHRFGLLRQWCDRQVLYDVLT
jgi:hypothetical protein